MKHTIWLFTILLICTSCQKNQNKTPQNLDKKLTETATSGEIYITVDENYKPIIEAEIGVFEHLYPDAKIHAIYLPGEEAIRRMVNSDSFRIAIAARNLSETEERVLLSQKTKNRPAPIAQDAIALISNKANPDSAITMQQLKDIIIGKTTQWKQISAQNPLKDIILVYDNSRSGTLQFLRDSLLKGIPVSDKAYAAGNSPAVLEYIAKNQNAIGIMGVNWVSDHDDKKAIGFLKDNRVMALETPPNCNRVQKYQQPYPGIIKLNCYPLSRYMYSLNRETGYLLGTSFVTFLCSGENGQRVILKSGLVPYYAVPRYVRFPDQSTK